MIAFPSRVRAVRYGPAALLVLAGSPLAGVAFEFREPPAIAWSGDRPLRIHVQARDAGPDFRFRLACWLGEAPYLQLQPVRVHGGIAVFEVALPEVDAPTTLTLRAETDQDLGPVHALDVLPGDGDSPSEQPRRKKPRPGPPEPSEAKAAEPLPSPPALMEPAAPPPDAASGTRTPPPTLPGPASTLSPDAAPPRGGSPLSTSPNSAFTKVARKRL